MNPTGTTNQPTHNFEKKLAKMVRQGKIPLARVSDAQVAHDSWCGIMRGGRCNCDPAISLKTR